MKKLGLLLVGWCWGRLVTLNGKNYDRLIETNRRSSVSVVLFASGTEGVEKMEELDNEFGGIVQVGVIDCLENEKTCKQKSPRDSYPTLAVIPPIPLSPFHIDENSEIKEMKTAAYRHVPTSNVKIVDDDFLTKEMGVPKVLLFSDKPSVPVMFNAVANNFWDRMNFGFAGDDNKLKQRFGVTKLPQLIIVRPETRPEMYFGVLRYTDIISWINIRAETFVKGGGFVETQDGPPAERPWRMDKIPQLTLASHQDICFRHATSRCVIYFKNGDALDTDELNMLTRLSEDYDKASPDARFKYMWVDASGQAPLLEAMGIPVLPGCVILNPHKTKTRVMALDKEATEEEIEKMLVKVITGDGRFKILKEFPIAP